MDSLKTYLLLYKLVFLQTCATYGVDILKSSLTFVIDDTASMGDEIGQVKESVNRLFDTVVNTKESQIENFVLVTFNDPRTSLRTITKDRNEFKNHLASIHVSGGGNCPEYCMSGIKLAIQSSLPQSLVYVFTDASARDYHMYEEVRSLAQKNQDQVTFLLTGTCDSREDPDYQVYRKLANNTAGDVYNMMKSDIKDVINAVIEDIKGRDEILFSGTFPPGYGHKMKINVDGKMGDVVISATGKHPSIEVKDHENKTVETKDITKKEEIAVKKIINPKAGDYIATVGSETETGTKVKAKTLVNIQPGFSAFEPTSFGDTVSRPTPDGNTFLSIQLHGDGVKLTNATILDMSGNVVAKLPLRLMDAKTKFYVAESFNPPQRFRVLVSGYIEADETPIKREAATPIERQNPAFVKAENVAPVVTIVGAPLIITDYNAPVQLKCNVHAYPKPDITWLEKDTGTILTATVSTKEIPYDYTSMLNIDNVKKNSSYECKATNTLGGNFNYIKVSMKTYFNVIETPKELSRVEYDEEIKIVCNVDASPPATITWYKGGTELFTDSNVLISADKITLTIKHAKIESQGKYICEARNVFNRKIYFFKIGVFGLVKPKIEKPDTEVQVLEGEDTQFKCRITAAKPWPTIQWYFQPKNTDTFWELEETSENLDLKNVTLVDVGTYKCIASNLMGADQYAVDLVLNYPPTIMDPIDFIRAKDGDVFILPCNVDGAPGPEVTWKKDGEELHDSVDIFITTNHSIRFRELKVPDTGYYTCEAKNAYGSDEMQVYVDVYVPVKIRVPKITSITTLVGTDLLLLCDADGYPKPKIIWTYNDLNGTSPPKTIRPNLKSASVNLRKVQLNDEGYYTCTASNVGGSLNLTYAVQIYAPPVIENIYPTTKFKAIKGDLVLKIECRATGRPKPTIVWTRDDLNIASGSDWFEIDDGMLIIKNVDKKSQGDYLCNATNDIGHDSIIYKVFVDEYPILGTRISERFIEAEKSADIECDIPHSKIDLLRWYKDGRIIATGELRLDRVSSSDAGVYSCRVSNMIKSLSAHVRVTVGYKPIFMYDEETSVLFAQDATVALSCDALGEPEPKVSWQFNNQTINVTDTNYDLTMSIDNIGTYTCEVNNGLGSIRRSFNVFAKECYFDIRKDFSSTKQPIMTSPSLTWPTFNVINHLMILNDEEMFYLHCPKGFSKFPSTYVIAFCKGEKKIMIRGEIFNYSDIKCREEADLTAVKSNTSCLPGTRNTKSVQIGYTLQKKFIKVYDVCLDNTNNVPIYSEHKLSADQHAVTENVTKWNQDILQFDFDAMYNCYNQAFYLSTTLQKDFHKHDGCCFDRRHLVNAKDLRPGIPISAAYTYLNVVPHWSTCNSKNWADVEERVRSLATSFRNPLTISTGTAKPLQMTSSTMDKENIYLDDNQGRMQPVAEFLWKVVVDPVSVRGIAIIQVNVPDLSSTEVSRYVLCRDICHRVKWMNGTNWRDVANGYTYCCAVPDFESKFHFYQQFSKGRIRTLTDIFHSPKHA